MLKQPRKKRFYIDGTGGKSWIGGLYYRRNILFSMLSNETITNSTQITVITDEENTSVFAPFQDSVRLVTIRYRSDRERKLKLYLRAVFEGADYLFPQAGSYALLPGVCPIRWTADFQHNRLREFFPEDEFRRRTEENQRTAESGLPLILSSQDCLRDFRRFYSETKENVYVVPFVSYIEPEIRQLSASVEEEILKKYELSESRYVAVMNQFWQHKNHILILKMLKIYFDRHPEDDLLFVFTGNLEDYRNPEYIESIKQLLCEESVRPHVKLLGFISRTDQLAVMKNAEYMIQPSLFEGWGTVVEDAKVLDKTVLLSDIPVHREQMNEKCVLFDPYDPHALTELVEAQNQKPHISDIEAGIRSMHQRAKAYSAGLEKLLNEQ